MPFQELRNTQTVFVLTADAQVEGLQAAQQ